MLEKRNVVPVAAKTVRKRKAKVLGPQYATPSKRPQSPAAKNPKRADGFVHIGESMDEVRIIFDGRSRMVGMFSGEQNARAVYASYKHRFLAEPCLRLLTWDEIRLKRKKYRSRKDVNFIWMDELTLEESWILTFQE